MALVDFSSVSVDEGIYAPKEAIAVSGYITNNSTNRISSFKCYLMNGSSYCVSNMMTDSGITNLDSGFSGSFYCDGITLNIGQQSGIATNLYTYMNSQSPIIRNMSINKLRVIVTFSDKSTYQADISLSNSATAIDARRNPVISKLWFNRCNSSGVKSNDGEKVLSTIKTSFSASKYSTSFSLILKQYDKSNNSLVNTVTVSDANRLTSIYNGITDSNMFINSFTFLINKNYYVEAELGDAYEKSTLRCAVPGSFVNMHLSSASNGGVALGKYSESTNSAPLFESNYNTVLYKDLEVKQNTTILGQITVNGQIIGHGNIHLIDSNGNNKFWVGISDGSVGIYGGVYVSGDIDVGNASIRNNLNANIAVIGDATINGNLSTSSLTTNNFVNLKKGRTDVKTISGGGFASWVINYNTSFKTGTVPYIVATPYIGDVVFEDLSVAINTINEFYFKVTVRNNGSASQNVQINWMAFGET